MNILFLADPYSIHNIKWMSFIAKEHRVFLLIRKYHLLSMTESWILELKNKYHIHFLGAIDDYSSVRFWKNSAAIKKIKTYIDKNQIHIFHILFAEPNALWATGKNQLKLPIVITTRGTDILKTIPSFLSKNTVWGKWIYSLYARSFKNASWITCTSIPQMNSVKKLIGQSDIPLQLIRTGVNIDLLSQKYLSFLPEMLKDKKFIFFPRAMQPIYQHEIAIEAIQGINTDLKKDLYFVFVDSQSKNKAYLEKISALAAPLEDKLIWLPHLSPEILYACFQSCDLVVMTPASDGTPVSAIEAMYFEKPLILPPLGLDADLFEIGPLYTRDGSAQAFTELISEFLQNKIQPETKIAKENVVALADQKTEMGKILQIYNKISRVNP